MRFRLAMCRPCGAWRHRANVYSPLPRLASSFVPCGTTMMSQLEWNSYGCIRMRTGLVTFFFFSRRTIISEGTRSVVVFLAQVGDQVLAHHPAKSILELHGLDEQVVLGVKLRGAHGRLEVEAEPFLNAAHPGALRQI